MCKLMLETKENVPRFAMISDWAILGSDNEKPERRSNGQDSGAQQLAYRHATGGSATAVTLA